MARDQAQADRSIELAREANRRLERTGGAGQSLLAASRGGATNLGAAFTFLGLDDWGRYYGDRWFTPFDPGSLLFRGTTAEGAHVQLASLVQGLLLDPLAVSERLRYTDLLRRPFLDGEFGVQGGRADGAWQGSASFDLEAYANAPRPLALSLIGEASDEEAGRRNDDSRSWSLAALGGLQLGPDDALLLEARTARSDFGVPGAASNPDPDDAGDNEAATLAVGYRHAFGGRNNLLGRIAYDHTRSRFTNDSPFGLGLDPILYSILGTGEAAGFDLLQSLGIWDVTGTACDPGDGRAPVVTVLVGGLCGGRALGVIDTAGLDRNSVEEVRTEEDRLTFQLGHAVGWGNLELSYEAELQRALVDSRVAGTRFEEQSTGVVLDPFDPANETEFAYGEAALVSSHDDRDSWPLASHADLAWRVGRTFAVEGGIFPDVRREDGEDGDARLGPRVGLAWQPVPDHWLRAAWLDERRTGIGATLAPVTVLGLAGDPSLLVEDGRVRTAVGRWDAEWDPHLFSTLELRHQKLEDLEIGVPQSLGSYALDEARITSLTLGVNAWLTKGLGVFATGSLRWSEDESGGETDGESLPLLAEEALSLRATWVHPSQVRVTLRQTWLDGRKAEPGEGGDLDPLQSTDLEVAYEPFAKRLRLSAGILNLLDRDDELASDIPAPGRTFLLGAAVRF